MQCAGCQKLITDRYVYMLQERVWHGACILCAECHTVLRERCYHRDGKFFCSKDFFRLFGTPCSGCSQGISPDRLIHRVGNGVYHVECFSCGVCGRKLETGDLTRVSEDGVLVCQCSFAEGHSDQENNAKKLQEPANSDVSGDRANEEDKTKDTASSGDGDSHDGGRGVCSSDSEKQSKEDAQSSTTAPEGKRRGPRTTIKAKQLEMLKSAFGLAPKPTRQARERLAKETGLSMRVIQVWFQNRRSKERRMRQDDSTGKNFTDGQQPGTLQRSHPFPYPHPPMHPSGIQAFCSQQAGHYHAHVLPYTPPLDSMPPTEQIPTSTGPLTSYQPVPGQLHRQPMVHHHPPYYQGSSPTVHSQRLHMPPNPSPSQHTEVFMSKQHVPTMTLHTTQSLQHHPPQNLGPQFQPPESSHPPQYISNPPQPWTRTPHSFQPS